MLPRWKLIFGKEYELGDGEFTTYFPSTIHEDGSGPMELAVGTFVSIREAIAAEIFLEKIYGRTLWEYYLRNRVDNDGNDYVTEEKGSHFHVGLKGRMSENKYKYLYILYTLYIESSFHPTLSKLGIGPIYNSYRNCLYKWAEKTSPLNFSSFQSTRRRYWWVTPTRNRGKTFHIELRASQGSIVEDFALFSVIYYAASKYVNSFGFDVSSIQHFSKELMANSDGTSRSVLDIIRDVYPDKPRRKGFHMDLYNIFLSLENNIFYIRKANMLPLIEDVKKRLDISLDEIKKVALKLRRIVQ